MSRSELSRALLITAVIILRGCVLAPRFATPLPDFPGPCWLCLRRLLCDWSWGLFLGEYFGPGGKEAAVVATRLPVRPFTYHHSRMRVVLGWRLSSWSGEPLDI